MDATRDDYNSSPDPIAAPMSSVWSMRLEFAGRLCLGLLAFSLPYETVIFSAGPLQVSNLELLLALVLLCTAALVIGRRRWRQAGWLRLPRSWLVLWALVALALLLSTLLAPEHRLNAAKAGARLLSGMALALCVPQLLRRRHVPWIVVPLLLGGLPAVVSGIWEVARGAALAWLAPFRAAPSSVGPFIRLTGSFDHANQAAMYLEATVPLLLAVTLLAYRRRAWLALPPAIAAALWLQAAVNTYSRTALVAIFLSAMLVALAVSSRRFSAIPATPAASRIRVRVLPALPWAALAVVIVALVALNVLFDPVVRMRFRTEGDNEWYNLSFDVPQALAVDAGHTVTTTITVRNEGDLTWTSDLPNVIHLGGHWYLPGEDITLAYTPRWRLPHSVPPDETVTMQVGLQAPLQEGDYQFRWDMIHEGSTWFSFKNGVRTGTLITVNEARAPAEARSPATEAALSQLVEAPPDLAPIPGRRVLWRIAARELLQRPLLGIGMDNYRLIYGRALDYEQWNDTIHTNSWYLEILVSLGLLGALPFFAWMGLLAAGMFRALRRPHSSVWQAALAAAIFAFFLHGLLDYFLGANSTGMLFWLFSGLWVVVESEVLPGV